jgi:type III pantothenate kinase
MILVDCGNSSIKAQYRVGNALIASYRGRYGDSWEDRFSRWLECLSSTHCYLSSVLDPVRQQQLDACLRLKFDSGVTRFSAQFESLGITNGYQEPERLGVDRWLALIGAAGITRQNCFVIDAGSAITIDLLGSDGRHLGGAILPGVNTSIEAFKAIFKAIDFSNPSIAKNRQPGC